MTFYETSDLGVTAMLVSLGHKIHEIRLDKQRKAMFKFEYSKALLELATNYFGKGVEVNAKSYYYTLREIKQEIISIQRTYENQNPK